MRATFMYEAGDVRVQDAADPVIEQPTDAIVRVVRSCVCGSDLHPYHSMTACGRARTDGPRVPRHRRGTRLRGLRLPARRPGDRTVRFRRQHLRVLPRGPAHLLPPRRLLRRRSGRSPGRGRPRSAGPGHPGQAPGRRRRALLPSLLTLADVYGTGHHAARQARVERRDSVTVIGDGAVGLLAVLSAKQLGAERIILMGRHKDRTDLGRFFGATDVVAERGEEGIAKVREHHRRPGHTRRTGGRRPHARLRAGRRRRTPRRRDQPRRRPAVRGRPRRASAACSARTSP